jgi:hypothetical protein
VRLGRGVLSARGRRCFAKADTARAAACACACACARARPVAQRGRQSFREIVHDWVGRQHDFHELIENAVGQVVALREQVQQVTRVLVQREIVELKGGENGADVRRVWPHAVEQTDRGRGDRGVGVRSRRMRSRRVWNRGRRRRGRRRRRRRKGSGSVKRSRCLAAQCQGLGRHRGHAVQLLLPTLVAVTAELINQRRRGRVRLRALFRTQRSVDRVHTQHARQRGRNAHTRPSTHVRVGNGGGAATRHRAVRARAKLAQKVAAARDTAEPVARKLTIAVVAAAIEIRTARARIRTGTAAGARVPLGFAGQAARGGHTRRDAREIERAHAMRRVLHASPGTAAVWLLLLVTRRGPATGAPVAVATIVVVRAVEIALVRVHVDYETRGRR